MEGSVIRTVDNYTTQQVKTGNEPCAQYSIPDARSECRSGYRKTSTSYTQYRHVTNERRDIRGSYRNYYTAWVTASSPPAELTPPHSGAAWRYVRLESRTITNYFCTPESNCQGPAIYETVEGNTGDMLVTGSFDVAYTQDELDRLNEEQLRKEQERLRELENQDDNVVDDIEDKITELLEEDRDVRQRERDIYGLPDIPENPEDTKYRVISPASYSIQNGRKVPNIRYVSIRFLSPENVANFVARGYEVQSVSNDIPLSPSKPYGQSIVQRNTALRPETEAVCTNCNQGRGRLTITQVANQQKNYNFTRRDSIVSRTSKRRVTR